MRDEKRLTFGFTVIELLVLLAIIGVCIGLIVPACQAVKDGGKQPYPAATRPVHDVVVDNLKTVTLDGCDYLVSDDYPRPSIVHKGNCRSCRSFLATTLRSLPAEANP